MANRKPLIRKLDETEKFSSQKSSALTFPAGFSVYASNPNYKNVDGYYHPGFQDSETVKAPKIAVEAVQVLYELKIINPEITYLDIALDRGKDVLMVKTLFNKDHPFVSDRTVLTLTAFGSSGYTKYTKTEEPTPFKPKNYRAKVLQASMEEFAAIGIKPKIEEIGKKEVLRLLYPEAEKKLVTKLATFPHQFRILMLLAHTGLFPYEELEPLRQWPAYFLDPLLEEDLNSRL